MKMTFREKVIHNIHKLSFAVSHPAFLHTYAKRFSNDFSQEDLEYCVSAIYEYYLGKKLNLNDPRTFNEKLNWLKCFYHDDSMTECADKVTAPDFFRKKTGLGDDYIVKNIGVYDSVDDIDFEALPSEFVLKSNWGSGKQIIVKNKRNADIERIKKVIRTWNDIKTNHYYHGFEYGYKKITPKIVCEEFISFEYKMEFFCFDGQPKYFWTIFDDKTDDVCADFYDAFLFEKLNLKQGYPNSKITIDKPVDYNEMINIASKLSKGFPFVRIDFFKTKKGFKFSEMTFYHWCGITRFEPDSFDLEFGKLINLPDKIV